MKGWFDLVRADTLFLFMITAAIAGLPRWARTRTGLPGHGQVAAGATLMALAFFCKQTGILYVAYGGLIVLVLAWRRVPIYVATAGLIGLGGTWMLDRTTQGWFWTYVSEIHRAHDFNMDRFWKSFANILWHFPALTIVVGVALVVVLVTRIAKTDLAPRCAPVAVVVGDVRGVDARRRDRLGNGVRRTSTRTCPRSCTARSPRAPRSPRSPRARACGGAIAAGASSSRP